MMGAAPPGRRARARVCGLLAVSAGLLVACGSSSSSKSNSSSPQSHSAAASGSSQPVNIAYFATQLDNPYVQADIKGAKDEAAASHATATVLNANLNPQTQLSQCEDAVTSGKYQALEISAVVGTVMRGCVTQAAAKHIKVISIDAPLGPSYSTLKPQYSGVTGVVRETEVQQGQVLAQYIKQACASKSPCSVGQITGSPSLASDGVITSSMVAGLRSNANIKLVATTSGNYLESGGQAAAQSMLAAHPDLNVIVAQADQMAIGAQKAVTSAHKLRKVLLIGDGGSTDAAKATCAGIWEGTVDPHPYDIGKLGAQIAIAEVRGQSTPTEINSAAKAPGIDKSNCATVKGQFSIG